MCPKPKQQKESINRQHHDSGPATELEHSFGTAGAVTAVPEGDRCAKGSRNEERKYCEDKKRTVALGIFVVVSEINLIGL